MRRSLTFILALLLLTGILSACGHKPLTCAITVSGDGAEAGVISFLDFSINVYADAASNPCGDCADQPVHLFAGASAEEAAAAMAEAVTRADDLWEVQSRSGARLLLREKHPGTITQLTEVTGPEGLSFTLEQSGREVPVAAAGTALSAGVPFPENPQRLAAVYGPSYELLTMLGAEDRIVVRADVQTDDFPWAERVFSRITQLPALVNVHSSVNFEELMTYAPDLVYTFPRENELRQLAKAGVAALPGQTGETLEDLKKQVRDYASTLGGDAPRRAEDYCQWFDGRLAQIRAVTDAIPEEEKKTVYYAGTDILTTYGRYSDLYRVVDAAGGIFVSAELAAGNRSQIDYEQLMAWNPDVIFIDHGGMNDGKTVEQLKQELQTEKTYTALTAVQRGQVYASPSGVFYWDMGLQKILLVEYMAKTLYPERFENLDMASEIQEFYQRFFSYELTYEDALRILNREDPV